MVKIAWRRSNCKSNSSEEENIDKLSREELAQMWDADLTEEDILEWTQVDCNNPGHQ